MKSPDLIQMGMSYLLLHRKIGARINLFLVRNVTEAK